CSWISIAAKFARPIAANTRISTAIAPVFCSILRATRSSSAARSARRTRSSGPSFIVAATFYRPPRRGPRPKRCACWFLGVASRSPRAPPSRSNSASHRRRGASAPSHELGADSLGNRQAFDPTVRVLEGPHPRLQAFDRELAGFEQSVLHVEARAAEFGHAGFDHDLVAEPRRDQEPRADIDQRKSGEFLALRQLELVQAERALEQHAGGIVEHGEIARKEHDAHGIAVAPLDADGAGIDQHSVLNGQHGRSGAREARARKP